MAEKTPMSDGKWFWGKFQVLGGIWWGRNFWNCFLMSGSAVYAMSRFVQNCINCLLASRFRNR